MIRQAERSFRFAFGKMTTPIRSTAQSHERELVELGEKAAVAREVVVTVTLNGEALLPLTLIVAPDGNEQFAPWGAPVQVSEAVPEKPPPPIDSL